VVNTDNFHGYKGAIGEMEDYFRKLVEKRRREPATDLISTLIEHRIA